MFNASWLIGIGIAMGAMLTVGVGGVATALALVAALLLPLEPDESRLRRAGRFVAGPLACVAVGTLIIYFAEVAGKPSPENEHRVEVLDDLWFLYPVLGIVVGACVFLVVGRKKRLGPS